MSNWLLWRFSPQQSESVLVQKIYTHFKRTPGTHKLGVLYVVDSVTRQWVEAARKSGQQVGPAAPDGTYAAGVNRVTELLPSLMADIISTAPEDQKVSVFPLPLFVRYHQESRLRRGFQNTCHPGRRLS